jgi:hypothetical protein
MSPPVAYHVTNGPFDFPFAADLRHAVSRFPSEWSRTPWPVAPTRVDEKPTPVTARIDDKPTPDRITSAIADLTDRTIAFRICRTRSMDRLTAKLEAAAGVVGRVTASLEERADLVIAREEAINSRGARLFDAKHAVLDSADAGLDGIEAKLALLSNDPLESSGPSPQVEPTPSAKEN